MGENNSLVFKFGELVQKDEQRQNHVGVTNKMGKISITYIFGLVAWSGSGRQQSSYSTRLWYN